MTFRVYLYARGPAFMQQCADMGAAHEAVVDLTPDQVVAISQKVAVMIRPPDKDEPQLLCLDEPRWCFKQR